MEENESLTMVELAKRKFDLSFTTVVSWHQLDDLEKKRGKANHLWKDFKSLWDYKERLRKASIKYGKEKIFEKWIKDNANSLISFKSLNELADLLHLKACKFCGKTFKAKRSDQIYCLNKCKQGAFQKKKKKKKGKANN